MQPLAHRSFSNGKVLVINIHGMMNLIAVLYEKDPTKYYAKLFSFSFLSFFLSFFNQKGFVEAKTCKNYREI